MRLGSLGGFRSRGRCARVRHVFPIRSGLGTFCGPRGSRHNRDIRGRRSYVFLAYLFTRRDTLLASAAPTAMMALPHADVSAF